MFCLKKPMSYCQKIYWKRSDLMIDNIDILESKVNDLKKIIFLEKRGGKKRQTHRAIK